MVNNTITIKKDILSDIKIGRGSFKERVDQAIKVLSKEFPSILNNAKYDLVKIKDFSLRYYVEGPSIGNETYLLERSIIYGIFSAHRITNNIEEGSSFKVLFPHIDNLIVDKRTPLSDNN